jgi:hypothetical protein
MSGAVTARPHTGSLRDGDNADQWSLGSVCGTKKEALGKMALGLIMAGFASAFLADRRKNSMPAGAADGTDPITIGLIIGAAGMIIFGLVALPFGV